MPRHTFGAAVECDRSPNQCDDLTADEYDLLARMLPECEYGPGRFMLRCTAWPRAIHARIAQPNGAPCHDCAAIVGHLPECIHANQIGA